MPLKIIPDNRKMSSGFMSTYIYNLSGYQNDLALDFWSLFVMIWFDFRQFGQ